MPEKKPVGMAIQITEDNRHAIAIVNHGVVPEFEAGLYRGTYFIYPYATDAHNSIVAGYVFDQNWMFTEQPSTEHFTEIIEI